jgi:valyl-tRNA synthetase
MKEFGKKYDRQIEFVYKDKLMPKRSKKILNTSDVDAKNNTKTFAMCLPPPNVTGVLHLWHALTVTVEDTISRYHMMNQYDVMYIPGTDHAGISTQVKVEEKLAKRWISKNQLGREKFLNEVRDFALDNRNTIINQLKSMGASLDRSRENFTLSPKCSRAVRKSFSNLYHQNKIYQWSYINNRCTRCQTVLSDVEVVHKNQESKLYYLDYFCIGKKKDKLTVATTRPETIFADVALAVHPDDIRYQDFVWTYVVVPCSQHSIPIIADTSVDPKYGTGVLKVTPFHDALDYEIGVRHNLPLDRCAITKEWILTDLCGQFATRHIEECYDILLENITTTHVSKIEMIQNNIACCERCNTKIQPLITTQWFVNVKEYAVQVLDNIKDKNLTIYPSRLKDSLDKWLHEIKPWCISRQLLRWHRIPVRNWKQKKYIIDEDMILDLRKKTMSSALLSTKGKDENQYCVLSIILFNCIADSRIENGIHIDKLIEIFTKPSIVPAEWNIWNTYYTSYCVKFKKQTWLLKELKMYNAIFDFELSNQSKKIIKNEFQLEEMLKKSYCLRIKEGKVYFDFELLVWEQVSQDSDVLDTRFSSALRPFSALGWPDETPDFKKYYPNTIIETWYDLIFFWVARMLMMWLANTGQLPFSTIYLHGLIRDEKGRKMSKTLGNGIDPLDLIEKYWADALRLSLIIGTTPGWDTNYSHTRIDYASKFINKFRNATRFVYTNNSLEVSRINLDLLADDIGAHANKLQAFDTWILDKTDQIIKQTTKWFETYEFWESYNNIVKTIWNDFCDRMIEVSKIEKSTYTHKVMIYCIGTYLKLLHPIIPFVTHHLRRIMGFEWFVYDSTWPTPIKIKWESENIDLLIQTIWKLRTMKQQLWSKNHEEVSIFIQSNSSYYRFIKKYETVIEKLLKTTNIIYLIETQEKPIGYTIATVQHVTIGIQEKNTINYKEEYEKIITELEDETQYKNTLETTLASTSFRSNASASVITEKEKKLNDVKHKITNLTVEIQKYKMKYSNL